jgi:hypothetical protein
MYGVFLSTASALRPLYEIYGVFLCTASALRPLYEIYGVFLSTASALRPLYVMYGVILAEKYSAGVFSFTHIYMFGRLYSTLVGGLFCL